jgi:hypothetical protein
MTGLANDQRFASVLKHNLRPMRPIFSHCYKFGKFTYLVNHAVFIFDLAEFTRACCESSYHLPSLIAGLDGNVIDQDGFSVSHQRNTPEPGHQRFLATASLQRRLEARSLTVRCLNSGSQAFDHSSGGAAICGCQGVSQGLLDGPFIPVEPGYIDSEQIVLYQSPIFILIRLQDDIIRAGSQRVAAQRFSPLLIELSFLFDHFDGDTQDDVGISSAVSIFGKFIVAVTDLQIIAKKSSCLCLGMGDQGLFLR